MNNLRKTTLALAVVAAVCGGTATAAVSQPVALKHATVLAQGDRVMGALPAMAQVRISVDLQLRDWAGINKFISNIGKPGQPRVMGAAEWNAKHAPTPQQAQDVVNFLKSKGFTNVEVDQGTMHVHAFGTPVAISRAFGTSMNQVATHDGRIAYANSSDIVVPGELKDHIFSVTGLQNVHIGHTFAKKFDPKAVHTMAVTGHLPSDFQHIYNDASLPAASGVVVGIFTQGSMTTTDSDLNKFTAGNGFPTVTTQLVNTDGTGTATSGVDEWDLDSQDIVAIAGGQVSKIIWYQTPSLSTTDMVDNFATIANANATKVINVSIGGCETGSGTTSGGADGDTDFAKAVTQGQTFSISTGDSGANECTSGTIPSWPADSQYVIAAAGTTLNASTGSSATWSSETEWKDSGGSESTFETKPTWQPSTCNSPCKFDGKFRGVADVAFDADPNSGAQLYLNGASPSTSTQVGGTSLASPLFVGTWARAAIQAHGTSVGFAAPLLYGISGAIAGTSTVFHDITSGSNGLSAAVGWDVVSGLGSINGANLSSALGGGGTTTPTASWTDTTSGLTATFTDHSTDSGGTITAHSWTFGDGGTSTTASPSHTYAASGSYSVTETVTDSGGKQASQTSTVTVSSGGGGTTPTANWTDTTSGLTATFTDSSTDSGGTITAHSWTFGDGGTSTTASPTHTYTAAGTYSVSEQVTDSGGQTATKTANVTVTNPTSSQLLANTGFESSGSWTASSGVLCTNSSCSGETAHAGSGFAWLDGYGSTHTDTLSQTVTVPSGHTSGTLQYYLHIDTAETTTSQAYDTLAVALYSGSTLVRTVATYSNLNKNSGYTVHSNALTSSDLSHSSLTLKFTGKEDSSLQTSFVIDDVTLTVN